MNHNSGLTMQAQRHEVRGASFHLLRTAFGSGIRRGGFVMVAFAACCWVAAGAWAADAPAASQEATNVAKAGPLASMDALDDKHKLAIGDLLSFRIVEDEEAPKPLIVTDSGELEVPYIGRYPAVNRTCQQLARDIKAELEKKHYYQATVIIAVDVMAKKRGRVYLTGAVRAPGPQDMPSDEDLTLSKAVLRAGGCTEFADKRHVKVTRKAGAGPSDNKTIVVDVSQILEKGKLQYDLPLEPDDLIFIPDRLFRF